MAREQISSYPRVLSAAMPDGAGDVKLRVLAARGLLPAAAAEKVGGSAGVGPQVDGFRQAGVERLAESEEGAAGGDGQRGGERTSRCNPRVAPACYPTHQTLYHNPYALEPTPDTPNPTPDTRHPTPDTRHPKSCTRNPQPQGRHGKVQV